MYAGIQAVLAKDTGRSTGVSFGRSPARVYASTGRVWTALKAAQGVEGG